MTTGMKKFTKGCLITALVALVIGAVICGVGGLLGGFRILDNMDVRGITGIPFVYRHGWFYGFGLWDDDDIYWGKYEDWQSINEGEDDRGLSLTADTLKNLYIEVGACNLYIKESGDEYVRLAVSGDTNKLRYHVENGSLWIVRKAPRGIGATYKTADKVYLYLPKGTTLDSVDIELGAGTMDSIALAAGDANIGVDAGALDIDGLTVNDEAVLSVGAGQIRLKELLCDTASMNIGAGQLIIDDAVVSGKASINLGMGSANIDGIIRGDLDVECGMGEVILDLDDAEQDHNYEIDCAMGTVKVGSRSYSGMGSSQTIDNGSDSDYNIDCSMGSVTVKFAK